MNISACVIAKDEEKNISLLMKSLKDCSEVILADGGSLDKTMEIAKSLGATVYLRQDKKYIPTQDNIEKFTKEYGYIPRFTTQSCFRHFSEIRNEVVKKAKNDWIFFPDADEFVGWDYEKIQKLTEKYDAIECPLVQSRDKDMNPTYWGNITKLYKKSKTAWYGRIHEVVMSVDNKIHTDDMRIDHYPKPNSQAKVTETLEYNALLDDDARTYFYLLRQYYYEKEYQKSLDMFDRFIRKATWRPEIAYAFLIRAKCAWQLQQGDKARQWCLNAIAINPDFAEALRDMAIYTGEDQSKYWKRYSEIATSDNVLFVNV